MRSRLFLPWSLLAGLLALVVATEGLKATALVLAKLKAKPSTEPPAASEEAEGVTEADAEGTNSSSTRSPLTGIPQIDYVHDPNLPRELNGYNLTEYPFYDRVPEDLDFKCDGLHDGFYASVPHKCQVYHHCLFGTRYDFLCANYTAFDQKTFICHFVSEVDCVNSHKYFKRNEALYKAATTTTPSTTTTTQAAPPPPPPPQRRPQRPGGRRRPYRRRPVYEYYYDDDYDEDYYDEVPATGKESSAATGPGRHFKNQSRRVTPVGEFEHDSTHSEDTDTPQEPTTDVKPRTSSVYDRPRVPPKIRRPVPVNEREKYDYVPSKPTPTATSDERVQSSNSRSKQNTKPSTLAPEAEEDFYDDEEEEYIAPPRSSTSGSRRKNQPPEYYPTAPERDVVRRPGMSGGRNVRRKGPSGRRRGSGQVDTATVHTPIEDEDYEEEELPRRPIRPSGGRRRAHVSYRDEYSSQPRQPTRSKYEDEEEEEEPVPAPRPAYISPSGGGRQAYVVRKRVQPQQSDVLPTSQGGYKRSSNTRKSPHPGTVYAEEEDDEEYYDDEGEEEQESYYSPRSRKNSRPIVQPDFGPTAGETQPRQSPNKRPHSSSRAGSASSPRTSQVQSSKISYGNIKDEEGEKQVRDQTQGQIFEDIRDTPSTIRPKVTRGKFTSNVNDEFSEEVKSDPPASKLVDNEKILPANNGRLPLEEQPLRTFPTSFSNFRNKFQQSGGSKSRTNSETDRFTSPAKTETTDNTNSEPKALPSIPPKPGQGLPILTKVIVKPLGGRTVDIPDNPEKTNLADLNDHDIDVTINDALHPTLHPTRSIASEFVPRTQEETQRGSTFKRPTSSTRYQSQNSDAINRSPSQLVSSQSQRLITRAPFDAHSKVKQSYDDEDTSLETSSPQPANVQYSEPKNVPRQPQLRYQQVNIPISSLGTGFINVQTRHQQRPLYNQ